MASPELQPPRGYKFIEIESLKSDSKSAGSAGSPGTVGIVLTNLSVMLAPMAYSGGAIVGAVPYSSALFLWGITYLGQGPGEASKVYVNDPIGNHSWLIPGSSPIQNAVGLSPNTPSTIIFTPTFTRAQYTIQAAFQPGGNLNVSSGAGFSYLAFGTPSTITIALVAVQ